MAQLIRLRNQPQKWLLKKQLTLLKMQSVLSRSAMVQINQKKHLFDVHLQSLREDIQAFLDQRKQYREAGFRRGIRHYQCKLASEIILFCVRWVTNVHRESRSIQQIAIKIADKIVNKTKVNYDEIEISGRDIINQLFTMISVDIVIPHTRLASIKERYYSISQLFHPTELFIEHENISGAQIRLFILDKSLNLDFDHQDLDRILGQVLQGL